MAMKKVSVTLDADLVAEIKSEVGAARLLRVPERRLDPAASARALAPSWNVS